MFLVDADVLLEWSEAAAARWLSETPLAWVCAAPPVDLARDLALDTVSRTAAVMAAAAPVSAGAACCRDAALVADWLPACVDAAAVPTPRSDPARLVEPVGGRRPPGAPALRRWNAALRENVQLLGVGWLRGRPDGAAAAVAHRFRGLWTVFEHGWAESEAALSRSLVPAAAVALAGHAEALGRVPPPADSVARFLLYDVAVCSRAVPAPRRWAPVLAG